MLPENQHRNLAVCNMDSNCIQHMKLSLGKSFAGQVLHPAWDNGKSERVSRVRKECTSR